MNDYLGIINRIIAEHHGIRHQPKQAGDMVCDIEALMGLQKAYALWTQSSTDSLAERQRKLEETRQSLEEALKKHMDFEEKNLTSLLGDTIMHALMLAHRRIEEQFRLAKLALAANFDTAKPEEIAAQQSKVEDAINRLCQSIEQHAAREDVLLQTLRETLEDSQGKSEQETETRI